MESRHIASMITTVYYAVEHFDFAMLRTQVQLADIVINQGTTSLSPSAIRKMRKADLAALVAHYLTEYQALADIGHQARIRDAQRIKPEGMTRSLFPKPKRATEGSRKSRRELTKNRHRKTRGYMRLLRATA